MGKGSDLYFQQQQARQLREMEKHQAAQSGQPLRKLSWTERNVLGLKDEPPAEVDWAEIDAVVESARLERKQKKRARRDSRSAEEVPTSVGADEDAPRLEIRGYKIDVMWDGQTLTVTAKNKVVNLALRGQDFKEGPLELRADQIVSTELKPASALSNGCLTIRTKDGRTYPLHFLRKSFADFAELYKVLPG